MWALGFKMIGILCRAFSCDHDLTVNGRPDTKYSMVENWILEHTILFRMGAFATLLILFAATEWLIPRRRGYGFKARRWFSNLSIVAINSGLLRLVFPLLAVEVAFITVEKGWGLFGLLGWPGWVNFLCSLLILDVVIYLQHVMFHSVPTLWRLHKVHHTDLDFDVTTGVRFHPIEIILSMGIKIATVAAFGITPLAIVIFEVILNGTSMFTHTNIKLPFGLDRLVRWLIVTPDMHRIHHSTNWRERDSNYGFNLSVWDRIFGTYRQDPLVDHPDMEIGTPFFRNPRYLKLGWLFAIPFMRDRE